MKVVFSDKAKKDFEFWKKNDEKKYKKIKRLILAISKDNYKGIGKPEPLKFKLSGFWSRRIDQENRLVYRIKNADIEIASCRYHYD